MSYPTLIYGPEGEQFNNYDARRWPLGTRMILQDGRRYVFAEAGGTALATGKVQQSEVPDDDHDTLAVLSGAAGARVINFTNGTDAIEADLYADGTAVTETAAGASEGYLFKIDLAHDSQGASGAAEIPLAAGYGLPLALDTSDKITLIKNPYQDVVVAPAPPEALILGIACSPVPIANWGWLQTWGPAAAFITGTMVIGGRVSASGTVTNTTGALESSGVLITAANPTIAQTTEILDCGWCMETAPTGDYGHVFLKIS
ncbi:hypothetical protein LCGC14_0815380 [marine sediment metagenome]|uniref:Uncharacterized protein n=1 Tax=marine sediment metagenome TaxID=412755 RepID=A0A0F9S5F6_9ZZZZ